MVGFCSNSFFMIFTSKCRVVKFLISTYRDRKFVTSELQLKQRYSKHKSSFKIRPMPHNTILEKKKKTSTTRSMHIILILAYGDDDKKIHFKLFRMYRGSPDSTVFAPPGH